MWNIKIQDKILYEDSEILVCYKPAGLAVQNSRMGTMDMEHSLKNYLAVQNPDRIPWLGVIHRLDQPVEGILVFAKNSKAAADLNRQMTGGKIKKIYLAVTDQPHEKKEGILTDYLLKDGKKNLSAVADEKTKGAKKAVLSYKIMEEQKDSRTATGKRYLVQVILDTGRHHQIRVQLAHEGIPLLGDRKYYAEDTSGLSLGLCAFRLSFCHPKTGKKMEFQAAPAGAAFQGFSLLQNGNFTA